MPHRTIGVVVIVLSLWARMAGACPDCASARLVQASVFDHRFWEHLVLISAPLLMLSVVCAWLYRLGLERTTNGESTT